MSVALGIPTSSRYVTCCSSVGLQAHTGMIVLTGVSVESVPSKSDPNSRRVMKSRSVTRDHSRYACRACEVR
jgi:hypothetical protein